MFRLKSVALFAVWLAALASAACSSAPEQPILYQFFTASRLSTREPNRWRSRRRPPA